MFLVHDYAIAVALCFVTMLCWGSWANTQKLAGKAWRFELFYWDYAIGVLLLSVLLAVTLGSTGSEGRGFIDDVAQAHPQHILSALMGGVVFNAGNILLVAAIALAGMAVAFPVGIGLALVLGVVVNYLAEPVGNPVLLFGGVAMVTAAIVFSAIAYKRLDDGNSSLSTKGLLLSLVAGVLMGFFYRFVASSMSADFVEPEVGKLTPYTATVFFSVGLFLSCFVLNYLFMKRPIEGDPVSFSDYFKGSFSVHCIGALGGIIWSIGMSLNILASGSAGFAISYGLGQGATMIAAFWGVFIWKEFQSAPKGTNSLIGMMFLCFFIGLAAIVMARIV
jgi:glucose uptake protein